MRRDTRESGFTLLEVIIAMVMVVILAMGLAGSMGAAFMADSASRDTARSLAAAQQVIEELQQLQYSDVLAQDGVAMLGGPGADIAVKISAAEVMVGMIQVEVYACRPTPTPTLANLGAMTMAQVKALPAAKGTPVRLLTYKALAN